MQGRAISARPDPANLHWYNTRLKSNTRTPTDLPTVYLSFTFQIMFFSLDELQLQRAYALFVLERHILHLAYFMGLLILLRCYVLFVLFVLDRYILHLTCFIGLLTLSRRI